MANDVLAFHGSGMPETEEEQATVMAAWSEWSGKLGASVVDGDCAIISANHIDEVVDQAKGCPILEGGGSIEVAETFEVM